MLNISLSVFQPFLDSSVESYHFLIGLFIHLMTNFLNSLHILEIIPLSDV
ncbi:hypothetical protein LEMLEM_LOCUS8346, partial [Lemmus lemmus]